jgi:hypothetical protein
VREGDRRPGTEQGHVLPAADLTLPRRDPHRTTRIEAGILRPEHGEAGHDARGDDEA